MRTAKFIFCALFGLVACAAPLRADVQPVRLRIRLAGAREAPPTLDDLLFMAARPARRECFFKLPAIEPVTNGYKGVRWYAGGWQRPIYLFEYSGLIDVPAGGDYSFLVRRPVFGPAYLLVNGEPLADFPHRGARRRWRQGGPRGGGGRGDAAPSEREGWLTGGPIHLEKGPAEFRALGFCEARVDFGLRWIRPGSTEPAAIPPTHFAPAEKLRFGGVDRPLVYRAADARLAGVPPFCFADDAVRPEIHVRSNLTNVEVAVEASLLPDGADVVRTFAATSSVAIVRGWGRVALREWRASECARIEWSVREGGELLARGVARFDHPPFDALPDGVRGGAFVRDGTNVVYVARRYGPGSNPEPTSSSPGAEAVLVDGFGGVASNLLDAALSRAFGGSPPAIAHTVDMRALVSDDEAMLAPRDLLALARLPEGIPSGPVLLAPEILGDAAGEDLGSFERRLAVVAGLLSEAGGRELVLVTPPPDLAGGVADMHDYAVRIHRVADAYGLRVADIYTLSRTGGGKTAPAPSRGRVKP